MRFLFLESTTQSGIQIYMNRLQNQTRILIFRIENQQQSNEIAQARQAKRRITLMVVIIGFVHLLSNSLTSLYRQLTSVLGHSFEYRTHLLIASNVILYTSHSLDIFFYYFFDNLFRAQLNRIICRS